MSTYLGPAKNQIGNGAVLWLTGLSGSGKTTLARALKKALTARDVSAFILDGDEIRRGLSSDLGFDARGRSENVRRVAEVARLLANDGTVVIAALISPSAADRARARDIVLSSEPDRPIFLEVHVDAPLAECEARDTKGLYRQARQGQRDSFTGISAPYETPEHPDLVLHTAQHSLASCVILLLKQLSAAINMPQGQSRPGAPAPHLRAAAD